MRAGFDEGFNQLAQSPEVPPYPGPYTIPILLDDVKRLRDFNMTRGSFFTIDASGMGDDWVAILRASEVPFMILGVTNVLHRPDMANLLFELDDSIEQLFDQIEGVDGLVVESEHIWLPNFLFDPHIGVYSAQEKPIQLERGAVWRIGFGLFQMAVTFLQEVIPAETYKERCWQMIQSGQVEIGYSHDETIAFRLWSEKQFMQARQHFVAQRDDPERGVLDYVAANGQVVSQSAKMGGSHG
jgi:hypothetical protein